MKKKEPPKQTALFANEPYEQGAGHERQETRRKQARGASGVVFCNDCRTDLRHQNVEFHARAGHDVKLYNSDPRRAPKK